MGSEKKILQDVPMNSFEITSLKNSKNRRHLAGSLRVKEKKLC